MKLAISLLAHNEESHVQELFKYLRAQTIFNAGPMHPERVDFFVVANGCTDATLPLAQDWFARLEFPDYVHFHPIELPTPSKTNAWNFFMKDLLPAEADVVCMIDGDIKLPQRDLIARALETLAARTEAKIVSDVSVKDYAGSSRLNPMRMLNRVFSRPEGGPVAICGQFYCARAKFLSKIVLPIGLLSQDGYLRAMILTDGLTRPEALERIHDVPGGFHLHPAYVSLARMYRFQKRQAIGTALNLLVYQEMERMSPNFEARMAEIAERNRRTPNWVTELIRDRTNQTDKFVPRSYVWRMYEAVRSRGRRAGLKWLMMPFAVAFDMVVAHSANADIRSLSVGSVEANRGKFKIRQ